MLKFQVVLEGEKLEVDCNYVASDVPSTYDLGIEYKPGCVHINTVSKDGEEINLGAKKKSMVLKILNRKINVILGRLGNEA